MRTAFVCYPPIASPPDAAIHGTDVGNAIVVRVKCDRLDGSRYRRAFNIINSVPKCRARAHFLPLGYTVLSNHGPVRARRVNKIIIAKGPYNQTA